MRAREIKRELRRIKNDSHNWEKAEGWEDGEEYMANFLGTFMQLDPCGRYHHPLSPNGITKRCSRYWENMEKAAQSLGMWLQEGEGDPCDIYLCKPIET
jgi:hypothetical protein